MASAFWLLLAGAGIADGKASVLQPKSYSIKQNGNYAFTPDAGYDGFSSVNVSVNVETKLQEKSVTPTKQEQTIVPDTGYDGLSKLVVGAIPASYIDTSGANATAPDILAPKTAYVNGELVTGTMQEYDGSVTNGTEGMKPQLNAPTISVSGRQLTINNPSTNGNFTEGYKIFVDGVEKSEQTANTLDLYSYFDEDGTYQLSVAAAAAQFADSNQSAKATYQKVASTGDVVWLKNAEPLIGAASALAAVSIGNYGLFAYDKNSTTAYDSVLTRTAPTPLSISASRGAVVGNYAILVGNNSVANVYDSALTRLNVEINRDGKYGLAATSTHSYALFGGGSYNNGDKSSTVDAYDSELTRTTPTELSVARNDLAATTVGEYALFGGGYNGVNPQSKVDAYDEELTHTTPDSLNQNSRELAAASTGGYAIFAGGLYYSNYIGTVTVFDLSLTKTSPSLALSQARFNLSATSINSRAIFGGGRSQSGYSSTVDVYNSELTRTTPTELSVARSELAATTVGEYALFSGGYVSGSTATNIVDVYTVKE